MSGFPKDFYVLEASFMSLTPPKPSIDWRGAIFPAAALMIVLIAVRVCGSWAISEQIEVTVVRSYAPRTCQERSRALFARSHRSEKPAVGFFGYCGVLITDRGAFNLIGSDRVLIGADRREDMLDRFRPGCRYSVLAFGGGDIPQKGDLPANHGKWTIIAIEGELDCRNAI